MAIGAGKTTLLNTISGLLKPTEGDIKYNNNSLIKKTPEEIVNSGIIQCPEGRSIFPRLTVYENLLAGAFVRKDKQEIRSDIENLMNRFPRLGDRRGQLGLTLSGGEQQMLAICRSLLSKPRVLLLDEPSMGLAPTLVREVFSIIKNIGENGTAILLVEQNALMSLKIANRAYVLETGEIKISGTAESLIGNELIRESYLGGY
jgi:branched-chain amino acid transport system ATP-binding protein